MLLKPMQLSIDEVDDIKNIVEKRRYIFVYKYDKPIEAEWGLHSYNASKSVSNHEIVLINESVTVGEGKVLPKGIKLFNRNVYRAFADRYPFDANGKIDWDVPVTFVNGTYSVRIQNDERISRYHPLRTYLDLGEPIVVSLTDILSGIGGGMGSSSVESEIGQILATNNVIQPFPEFYNVEDQLLLSSKHNRNVGDFWYDYNELPRYMLGCLRDKYTKAAVINLPSSNAVIDCSNTFYTNSKGRSFDAGMYKENVADLFINCLKAVQNSLFNECSIIIETETGLFNIPKESLKLKYFGVTKEEISKSYAYLVSLVSTAIDSTDFAEPDAYCMIPARISIFVSNSVSLIRLSDSTNIKVPTISGKSSIGECVYHMNNYAENGYLPNAF